MTNGRMSQHYDFPTARVNELLTASSSDDGAQPNKLFVVPDAQGNPDVLMYVLGTAEAVGRVTSRISASNAWPAAAESCVAFGLRVQRWNSADRCEDRLVNQTAAAVTIVDRCVSHCIVGLPSQVKKGEDAIDPILTYTCAHHSDRLTHSLNAGAFYRLLHGMWISSEVVDWYAACLRATAVQSAALRCLPIRTERTNFFWKLDMELRVGGERRFDKVANFTCSEALYSRVLYPSFYENHFYLAVFDVPREPDSASGRLMILDPIPLFASDVVKHYREWLTHRGYAQTSIVLVHGGIQGKNETECGIFCLSNMEAMLQLPHMFSLEAYRSSAAATLTVKDCARLRTTISSVLREHCIRWLKAGIAIEVADAPA
jgi:hypothetical protein